MLCRKLPFNSLEDVEEQSRVQTVEEEAAPEITQVPTIKASPNSSADRVIVCKVEKPATPEHDNQVTFIVIIRSLMGHSLLSTFQ